MMKTELRGVVDCVLRRAQRQGYVVPRDVREELIQAGLADEQWKDILNLARESLHYRQGRYYYVTTVSPRLQAEQTQQDRIKQTIRQLIRRHKQRAGAVERRGQDRIDFIQPVKVRTEDGREFRLLSRDLSITGIRLIGTRSFLGQKVRVLVQDHQDVPTVFLLFGAVAAAAAIVTGLFAVETKGRVLEEASP